MSRRLALTATTLLVAALAAAPAHAGASKSKTIKGSYKVTLTPDPTLEVTGQVGDGCQALIPSAVDNHEFTVPGAGTLHVVLDSPDPTGSGNADWDLWILDSDGSVLDGSHGASSHEETTDKFKKGQKITISVCNLIGGSDGTVTYEFKGK
jgi:hypothetical protein